MAYNQQLAPPPVSTYHTGGGMAGVGAAAPSPHTGTHALPHGDNLGYRQDPLGYREHLPAGHLDANPNYTRSAGYGGGYMEPSPSKGAGLSRSGTRTSRVTDGYAAADQRGSANYPSTNGYGGYAGAGNIGAYDPGLPPSQSISQFQPSQSLSGMPLSHSNSALNAHPRSRSTSRPASRAQSTLSKSQSLIKKSIDLQDLKPADVLIERFVAWKAIVKQLCMYFEGIADIETNTARELTKLAGVIQVPFRSGNQFLGEGGLQDVYYAIRDQTRTIADQHANLGRTVDSSIVQHLKKLGEEVKAHIKNIQNDTGKLAAGVTKERETSTRLVGDLANSVSMYRNTPLSLPARSDPYLTNSAVARQLQRQVLEENLLQKSIVIMQQNSAHFEEGIVRSIKSAWETFSEWQARSTSSSQQIYTALSAMMRTIQPDREWIAFAARADHLLDPSTPLRDPTAISYPLKNDPAVFPIHRGHLERKATSGLLGRQWREGYYVLTPAGFLHEFASADESVPAGQVPSFSLFLPNCTLGPASGPNAARHGFHIEGRKDGVGSAGKMRSGKSFRALFSAHSATHAGGGGGGGNETSAATGVGGDAKAWEFRARSHEAKMEWWNDIRMLCARYLVASEVVKRSGPVENAVRNVGYTEDLEAEEEYEELEELEVDRGAGYLGAEVDGRGQQQQQYAHRVDEGGDYEEPYYRAGRLASAEEQQQQQREYRAAAPRGPAAQDDERYYQRRSRDDRDGGSSVEEEAEEEEEDYADGPPGYAGGGGGGNNQGYDQQGYPVRRHASLLFDDRASCADRAGPELSPPLSPSRVPLPARGIDECTTNDDGGDDDDGVDRGRQRQQRQQQQQQLPPPPPLLLRPHSVHGGPLSPRGGGGGGNGVSSPLMSMGMRSPRPRSMMSFGPRLSPIPHSPDELRPRAIDRPTPTVAIGAGAGVGVGGGNVRRQSIAVDVPRSPHAWYPRDGANASAASSIRSSRSSTRRGPVRFPTRGAIRRAVSLSCTTTAFANGNGINGNGINGNGNGMLSPVALDMLMRPLPPLPGEHYYASFPDRPYSSTLPSTLPPPPPPQRDSSYYFYSNHSIHSNHSHANNSRPPSLHAVDANVNVNVNAHVDADDYVVVDSVDSVDSVGVADGNDGRRRRAADGVHTFAYDNLNVAHRYSTADMTTTTTTTPTAAAAPTTDSIDVDGAACVAPPPLPPRVRCLVDTHTHLDDPHRDSSTGGTSDDDHAHANANRTSPHQSRRHSPTRLSWHAPHGRRHRSPPPDTAAPSSSSSSSSSSASADSDSDSDSVVREQIEKKSGGYAKGQRGGGGGGGGYEYGNGYDDEYDHGHAAHHHPRAQADAAIKGGGMKTTTTTTTVTVEEEPVDLKQGANAAPPSTAGTVESLKGSVKGAGGKKKGKKGGVKGGNAPVQGVGVEQAV